MWIQRWQTSRIFPGAQTQGQPEAALAPPPGCELPSLRTADGVPLGAVFGPALGADGRPAGDPRGRPAVVYFYGNASCAADNLYEFERFRRLGAHVLLPDYVGYGMSGGHPGEAGCYATADAAWNHLASRPEIDPARIVVAGRSLGSAVAIDLASRRPAAGLIAISPFTSMREMARRVLPWLPASLVLRHHFDNRAKIAEVGCPILLIHGGRDTYVSPAMADRLAAQARTRVERYAIPEGEHHNVIDAGGAPLWAAIGAFLSSL